MTTRYRLARLSQRIPMPGQPGRFFPQGKGGQAIDPLSPLYARMITDGDLVPADKRKAAKKPAKRTAAKPAAAESTDTSSPV